MSEDDWARSTDPDQMLSFLRASGKLSERKARLFACAAVRRVWHLLADGRSRRAVEVAEAYADHFLGEAEWEAARTSAYAAAGEIASVARQEGENARLSSTEGNGYAVAWRNLRAANAATLAVQADAFDAASDAPSRAVQAMALDLHGVVEEKNQLVAVLHQLELPEADLLRDLFGPAPFRSLPSLDPSLRAWNGGLIVKLATAIYEERSLPEGHLDSVRLGVLGDALEEAGCTDPDILGHLRQQGAVHVKGCFVIDLLTGRE